MTPEVLAERIEALCDRVDEGFGGIRAMISAATNDMKTHAQVDESVHRDLRKEMEAIKIDVAAFKARWSMLAVAGSALVSAAISAMVGYLMKGG